MQVRKTATISLYHQHGTGKMIVSISYRGKVQKKIVCETQVITCIELIDKAKEWAFAHGFTRAVVI